MKPDRFIRRPEVERLTGLPRSSLYEKMARGDFPKPRKIGDRAVAWSESDIARWQRRCKSQATV
jgi:prophage regulatory protein